MCKMKQTKSYIIANYKDMRTTTKNILYIFDINKNKRLY